MDQQMSAILELVPARVRHAVQALPSGQCAGITELRLRVDRPCTLSREGESISVAAEGGATEVCDRPG